MLLKRDNKDYQLFWLDEFNCQIAQETEESPLDRTGITLETWQRNTEKENPPWQDDLGSEKQFEWRFS